MRKHYLDNIRIIIILMLFPYHTFMIWNNYGTKFYVWGGDNNILSSIIVLMGPWFMPILFLVAGISARYSLEKRDTKTFIKERINKLLIPFIFGLILFVPFQTLYARKFFYNYNGSIIDNYKYFFTHFSDLNGYDGMFTFGHLWFLLYLFIISLISLLIIKKVSFKKIDKINIFFIILMFIPLFIFYNIGNFGGQSIGKYILLYLLGYYMFTDLFIDKLVNYKYLFIPLFIISEIILVICYYKYGYYNDLYVNFVGWIGICTIIILGKLLLNKETIFTKYFNKSSFPIYILHQTILVIIGYYTLLNISNIYIQVSTIILGSFIITILMYEIIKRIPYIRKTIGIK